MKTILKRLGYALVFLLVAALITVLFNYALFKRLFTYPMENGATAVGWYEPLEYVAEGPIATYPEGDPARSGISSDTVRAAIDYGTKTNSVALLVLHRGALVVENYWPGYGIDSRTDPASMHKSVMSLLFGVALDEGHIDSLDDPVSKYLQEWIGKPEGDIPLRALLQMASGLENAPFSPNPFGKSLQLLIGTDIEDTALGFELANAPGTEFSYNNVNSQLLGMVLEAATKMRYARYLSEKLWSRIGAPRAYVWLDDEDGLAHTFCCLHTTGRGWLAVGSLLLNGGRYQGKQIIPADYLREALSPSPNNPNYGYQIWLGSPYTAQRRYSKSTPVTVTHSSPYLANDLFFFDGFGGQRVYVIPSEDLVIVRTGKQTMDWDDAILPNLFLRDLRDPAAP